MFAVPLMVRWVLRLGLNVLWMDTDVIALANPFPVIRAQVVESFREHSKSGSSSGSSGLLLASVDGRVPDEDLRECRQAYSSNGGGADRPAVGSSAADCSTFSMAMPRLRFCASGRAARKAWCRRKKSAALQRSAAHL